MTAYFTHFTADSTTGRPQVLADTLFPRAFLACWTFNTAITTVAIITTRIYATVTAVLLIQRTAMIITAYLTWFTACIPTFLILGTTTLAHTGITRRTADFTPAGTSNPQDRYTFHLSISGRVGRRCRKSHSSRDRCSYRRSRHGSLSDPMNTDRFHPRRSCPTGRDGYNVHSCANRSGDPHRSHYSWTDLRNNPPGSYLRCRLYQRDSDDHIFHSCANRC